MTDGEFWSNYQIRTATMIVRLQFLCRWLVCEKVVMTILRTCVELATQYMCIYFRYQKRALGNFFLCNMVPSMILYFELIMPTYTYKRVFS